MYDDMPEIYDALTEMYNDVTEMCTVSPGFSPRGLIANFQL